MTANCHHFERTVLIAGILGAQIVWQLVSLPEVVQRAEDFAGVAAGDDYAREIDALHVAFERVGIQMRLAAVFIELDAEVFEIPHVAGV